MNGGTTTGLELERQQQQDFEFRVIYCSSLHKDSYESVKHRASANGGKEYTPGRKRRETQGHCSLRHCGQVSSGMPVFSAASQPSVRTTVAGQGRGKRTQRQEYQCKIKQAINLTTLFSLLLEKYNRMIFKRFLIATKDFTCFKLLQTTASRLCYVVSSKGVTNPKFQ